MSSHIMHICVLGEPKAQARHRHFTRGNWTQTYDPSQSKKGTFASIVQESAPKDPLDCPIMMEIDFYMKRPKNHYKINKSGTFLKGSAPEWHTSKPDIDNLCKFVQDALNGIYYRDDSLICQTISRKLYSEKPRTEITISTLL